ncbi:MAG: YlbF family regulator [Lachnospiraceae bacterium]|nr:YlbF family regulator [Lachnospiraceae bacterium]
MDAIEKSTIQLVESIRQSDIYLHYLACEQSLKAYPGTMKQLDSLRSDIVAMYSDSDGDELLERSEELSREYREMQKIPQVNAYLEAEAELCQEVRDIYKEIVSSIGIRVPDLG